MLNRFFLVTVFFLVTLSSAQAQLPDFTSLVENVSPAVVKINTVSKGRKQQAQQLPQGQIPEIFRDLFEQRQQQKPPQWLCTLAYQQIKPEFHRHSPPHDGW